MTLQRKKTKKYNYIKAPWFWILPAVALVFVMRYATVAAGGWYAFTDWNGISFKADFVGLKNFQTLFQKKENYRSLFTTIRYTLCLMIGSNILGVVFASLLNRGVRMKNFLRVLIFIPVIMLPMSVSYTWKFIYQYDGPLNTLLNSVHLSNLATIWLAHPKLSFWAIMVVVIWRWAGRCMLIYLAGLQNISEDVEDAAIIDGASAWQRFTKISLPLLAPSMTITFTLTLTAGLNIFDEIMALTNGGPNKLTESLATVIYKETYVLGNFGYGAALSLVLTILVVVVALAQLLALRKREEEMQ